MDFSLSSRQVEWRDRVRDFMLAHIHPAIPTYQPQTRGEGAARWTVIPVVEALKVKAYAAGLWNLFLPPSEHDEDEYRGAGLSNLDHAANFHLSTLGMLSRTAPDTARRTKARPVVWANLSPVVQQTLS